MLEPTEVLWGQVIDGEMLAPDMATKDVVHPPKRAAAAGITLKPFPFVLVTPLFCSIHLVGDQLLYWPWEGSEPLIF